jgi:hypothetical protein
MVNKIKIDFIECILKIFFKVLYKTRVATVLKKILMTGMTTWLVMRPIAKLKRT